MSRPRSRLQEPGLRTRLLFKQLQLARSPAARFQVVMKALHFVRGLDPQERRSVLRHLGLEEGAKLLRTISPEDGDQIANVLTHEVEALEDHPERAREFLADLKSPERRRAAVARGLSALAALLASPADVSAGEDGQQGVGDQEAATGDEETGRDHAEDGAASTVGELAGRDETDEGPMAPAVPPQHAFDASEVPGLDLPPPPAPSPTVGTALRPESDAGRSTGSPSTAPIAPSPPGQVGAEPQDEAVAGVAAEAAGSSAPMVTAAPAPAMKLAGPSSDPAAPVERRSDVVADIVQRVRREPRLHDRLISVRTLATELHGADVEQLIELVELFPDGWARQRAVERLLTSGAPEDVSAAPELVRRALAEPRHRLFALTALAATRELGEADRRACVDALPPGALRRRLAARLQAASSGSSTSGSA